MKKFIRILCLVLSLSIVISLVALNRGFASGAGDGKGILAYGVDVSSWQGKIDWQKVKNDGKTFAILRIGTTKGKDTYFEENYINAKKAGLNVGCYFYTYAVTVEEAERMRKQFFRGLPGSSLSIRFFMIWKMLHSWQTE